MPGLRQQLQNTEIQYSSKGKEDAIPNIASERQIHIYNAVAKNNSGSSAQVGIMRKMAEGDTLRIYSLIGSTYTQLNTSAAFQIFDGTSGNGYAVGSKLPPHLVGLTISSANTGGTFVLEYHRSGFAAFQTLPTGSEIESPTDYSSTGDIYNVYAQPQDMVVGPPSGTTGLDPRLWYFQVRTTAGMGGAVEADDLWVGNFLALFDVVANGSGANVNFDWNKPFPLNGSENIIPYFNVPSAANRVSYFFTTTG